MRLLCELLIIGALVWLGWSKSFQGWTNQLRGIPETKVIATANAAAPTAALPAAPRQPFLPRTSRPGPTISNGDWMWDPGHRGSLDAPATKANAASAPTVAPHANYWIDAHGVKHYTNGQPAP